MNQHELFISTLAVGAECLGIALERERMELMWRHFKHVLEANQAFNLTRITAPADAAAKLYADSLAPLSWAMQEHVRVRHCLDVGTGAGIPAVPLAAAGTAWKVTAIDSTGKKARFVQQCADTLAIGNLRCLQARAGEWRPGCKFDLVLFKAVGTLSNCLRQAGGLVARDGHVAVFKGPGLSRRELDQGQSQADRMGLKTWAAYDYAIPFGDERLDHTLIAYRRVK